jgi:hypothetical protein
MNLASPTAIAAEGPAARGTHVVDATTGVARRVVRSAMGTCPAAGDRSGRPNDEGATVTEPSNEVAVDEFEDPDAGPASRPTGAAAHESPSEDPDAGPASQPDS